MNWDTILWRLRILGWKSKGQLPSVPWKEIPTFLVKPSEQWNYECLATPVTRNGTDDMVLYETAIGRFYGRPQDRSSVGGVIAEEVCGIYQRAPVIVRPGDIVFDLGGHLGTFTRVALDSGAKLVVAFEANTDNARCFRRTFHDEIAAGKVILIESPVWSEQCTVRFSGHGLVGQVSDTGELKQAVTIDDTVRQLGLDRVDFIKTDIEGAERHALQGAARVLSTNAPRLALSSYHYSDDPAVLRDIVLQYHAYDVSFDKDKKRMFCFPR